MLRNNYLFFLMLTQKNMENETNTNKNSSSIMVWIIIGILVVAAIVVVLVTTNQTSRPVSLDPVVSDESIDVEDSRNQQDVESNNQIDTVLEINSGLTEKDYSEVVYDDDSVFNMLNIIVSESGWEKDSFTFDSSENLIILTVKSIDVDCLFKFNNLKGIEINLSAGESDDVLFNMPPTGEYLFSCSNNNIPSGKLIIN